jgi:hypothetical protein
MAPHFLFEFLFSLPFAKESTQPAHPGTSSSNFYSYRSATIGSTLIARRAGIRHARKALSTSSADAPANVLASVAATP